MVTQQITNFLYLQKQNERLLEILVSILTQYIFQQICIIKMMQCIIFCLWISELLWLFQLSLAFFLLQM